MLYNKNKILINRVIELYSENIVMRKIPDFIKNEFNEVNCKYHDIRGILKDNKIPINRLNYRLSQKRFSLNEDYFSNENEDTFYFAGFLLGDGYFQKNRKNLIYMN